MHPDQHYIEALRQGDEKGIRDIYRQFAAQAQRWILSHGGSSADAEDIFQETLMAVYEKALKPDFVLRCPLGGLLHVIWSRKWVDRLRQNKRDTTVRNAEAQRYSTESDPDTLSVAEEALASQQRQRQIAAAFEQLSDLCRQLLTLLSQGIAPREAAAQLQMNSVDTLYRRKNACTERWRQLLGPTAA
jgi:RNA polymerase sigma factor (sigma-70 family)